MNVPHTFVALFQTSKGFESEFAHSLLELWTAILIRLAFANDHVFASESFFSSGDFASASSSRLKSRHLMNSSKRFSRWSAKDSASSVKSSANPSRRMLLMP